MSRFNNVKVLLDTADDYDLANLTRLVHFVDELRDAENLAEDIAFVIISLWGMVPDDRKYAFKERLTDEMVDLEMKEMFDGNSE